MAEERNTKYPHISLAEAISRAKAIYEREHMAAMTPTVAAEAMGYKGISGASLKAISALKKYGLLEGRDDQVRLSKQAQVIILDPPESEERVQAIGSSALKPPIFSEIYNQFRAVGSERNIAVYLEKQGFKPDTAALVARNYKETLGLMGGKPLERPETPEGENVSIPEAAPTTQPRHYVLRAEPGAFSVTGSPTGARSETIGTATAPFRIAMNGSKLHIEADVDLKGLQLFKQVLDKYEAILALLNTTAGVAPRTENETGDGEA